MKKKHILWSLGLLLAVGMALSSCTENEDNTIVPIGTEYYIHDILSVIPDSLQTRFLEEFGSIPEGFIPPKIEGSYKMNPKQRVSSNVPGFPIDIEEDNDVFVRFYGQHNELVKMDLKEDDPDEIRTDTVYVCGDGDAFTVYCIENKPFELELDNVTYHVEITRGIIMKGRMTPDGIADFRYATIVRDVTDFNGPSQPIQKGTYYIYKDGNGKAENFDW